MELDRLFSDQELEGLRIAYGSLKTMDPCCKQYQDLIKLLDNTPQSHLQQFAEANIPFVSMLARRRIVSE